MRRSIRTILIISIWAVFAVPFMGTGAGAGVPWTIEATSVALNEAADCSNGDLDMGIVSTGDVSREAGVTTDVSGAVLGDFEQSTGFDDYDATFFGYGQPLAPDQPDGTVIGSWAYIGATPPNASNTAEWFVLYRCEGTDGTGTQEVLSECFGPFGTCPTSAEVWAPTIDAVTPVVPGADVEAAGTGCYGDGGVARLKDGGTVLATADGLDASAGSWSATLTVPDGVPPGTELSVEFLCGSDAEPTSEAVASQFVVQTPDTTPVTGDSTTTSTTSTTTTTTVPSGAAPAAQPTVAQPTFTG